MFFSCSSDDLILRQGVEEEENPSSRLQDVFLKQNFKPPSPPNDCDSNFESGSLVLKPRIDSPGVETKGKVGVLIYLVSSVLFLDVKFDSLTDRCRI